MMQPDQAVDYVGGIFARNDVPFVTTDDGRHRVLAGSTAIWITFAPWGSDDSVVSLAGTVLEQLDQSVAPQALVRINQLNCENYFGKYCFYGDTLRVEHDLLASRLQADELLNVLSTIARQADERDDELQKELGGKTWEQVEQESQEDSDALDT